MRLARRIVAAATAAGLLAACRGEPPPVAPVPPPDAAPSGQAGRAAPSGGQAPTAAAPPPTSGTPPPAGVPPAPAPPLAPGQPPAGAVPGVPDEATSRGLLAKVEALGAELERRPKTLEIEVALGNLYLDNQRYPEAIAWYTRALERAAPASKRWEALPRAVRERAEGAAADGGAARAGGAPRSDPAAAGGGPAGTAGSSGTAASDAPDACARTAVRGFAELLAEAERRLARREADAGARCLAEALRPAVDARDRRANAYFFVGDQEEAIAELEAVLAHHPRHLDSRFHLGLILAETAGTDAARIARARTAWERFLEAEPAGPRAAWVKERLRQLEGRLTRSPSPGGAAPPARTPSSR